MLICIGIWRFHETLNIAAGCHVGFFSRLSNILQETTIAGLVEDWNAGVPAAQAAVKEHNDRVLAQVEDGSRTAQHALSLALPHPRPLSTTSRWWSGWFLRKWGWSMLARGSETQVSLPFEAEEMRTARQAYKELIEAQQVHPALILNYDQLWRCAWHSDSRLLYKSGKAGTRSIKKKAPARANKKLHAVRHARILGRTAEWLCDRLWFPDTCSLNPYKP